MRKFRYPALALLMAAPAMAADLTGKALTNPTAYIPSQCYTVTKDEAGGVHNPCFTCHVRSRAPHYINDQDLQQAYSFPGPALKNPWTNLFVDRTAAVLDTPDDEILAYVRADNYHDAAGGIALAARLADLPAGWDADGDGAWAGFVPDASYRFDAEGFDLDAAGRMTGWRAFAYQPLPGTFWPTNGSTDDVMIRLPVPFRAAADGTPDRGIYKLNLAITEALIKRRDVGIAPADEAALGVDLDLDGRIGTATRVGFVFPPEDGRAMHYVGRAGVMQDAGTARLAAGLYPEGTEFLHTVRYLDPVEGGIAMAPRIKEVRYMVKTRWQTYFDRQEGALAEAKERADFPDRIALFDGNVETGISNGTGWRLQGFIEDAQGELRPQTFEETVFCMGCHGGIGVTDDDTFAFPRKLDNSAFQGGWAHWTQGRGLRGVPELIREDGSPEYAHYLRANGAGDEFRGNMELLEAWLDDQGQLDDDRAEGFRDDIAALLYPSAKRALALNVAYREIVREQSFIRGRDATIVPQGNVHREVTQDRQTGVINPERPWYGAD
ncbi:hypothetical protein [Actibacterium sp.]|uniref:hypothetical protein n=1 Tax=Actibacterium sp. TaxID=1872125 RepID=UPI00257F1839|nr:hypothetical protein [Actibacterium sp.]